MQGVSKGAKSLLTDYDIEYYIRAGRIACTIRREVERLVGIGTRLIDIAETVEKRIKELGGEPAFPVNISLNNVAAHYTPKVYDTLSVSEGSIVKIDIGVHVNGYVADTATTIVLSDAYRPLVEAAKNALEKALALVAPGKRFSEVGAVIEKVIKSFGFKPVYNLSGHKIDRYTIHAGETIPNFNDILNLGKFRPNSVYALEPFATNGLGFVTDTDTVVIYALKYNPKRVSKLSKETYEFYSYIYSSRKSLPFAERWYANMFGLDKLKNILRELESSGLLTKYPVLIEKSNGMVTQFEHTVIVSARGDVMVTTDGC